jgi:predicted RNase H-like HicB family nuclease
MSRTYEVEARWDSEAGVWVAESNDIPGLVAEAESVNALVEKIRVLVPELFELNGGLEPGQKVVDVLVRAHREKAASVLVASGRRTYREQDKPSDLVDACSYERARCGVHEIWCSLVTHRRFSVDDKILSAIAVLKQAGISPAILICQP